MRVYIATKFENAPRAIDIATALEAAGHEITYKWWTNADVTREQAAKDMKGVRDADALVLIAETNLRYSGALTEFGMALAWNIPVYLVGHALDVAPTFGPTPNIFTLLGNVHRGIEALLLIPAYYMD